ncbi:MAG: uroporphyrinogen methyltransferase / synthase [Blastocatellia bacterium]|jgi:uroporphyrinogen III methyltransferase/synthase|nr:uroporphyrinogen methyltransferase / synthase [Blastocatellia bacterium]
MGSNLSNQTLSGRTVLCSPTAPDDLATDLSQHGARVLTWPTLDIGEPENHEPLDEAIENLFGYDWLIFQNVNSANFFIRRFQTLRHEISELDALRVCGVGEAVAHQLEESQVHIDVIPVGLSTPAIFDAIETYVGGRNTLPGLNFLIPVGSCADGYLQGALENAGARVDPITTYRTIAANDSKLAHLNALLAGGGIDCIVFNSSDDAHDLAQLLDTNDLSRLLAGVLIICAGPASLQTAVDYGLRVDITTAESAPSLIVDALAAHLSGHFREPSP